MTNLYMTMLDQAVCVRNSSEKNGKLTGFRFKGEFRAAAWVRFCKKENISLLRLVDGLESVQGRTESVHSESWPAAWVRSRKNKYSPVRSLCTWYRQGKRQCHLSLRWTQLRTEDLGLQPKHGHSLGGRIVSNLGRWKPAHGLCGSDKFGLEAACPTSFVCMSSNNAPDSENKNGAAKCRVRFGG